MSSSVIPYSCEVWQPDRINGISTTNDGENWSPQEHCPEFLIDVFVTYMNNNDAVQHDTSLHTTPNYSSTSRYFHFTSERHHFVESSISWSTISNMLSHMLVPFHAQPLMIQKITTIAREIALQSENLSCKTISLAIALVVGQERLEEEEEEEMDQANVSKAIAGLENVKIEELGENNCVICLEDMLLGCEAARLPCLHFYHEDCILNWLEKSNFCPLCRFKMPL
ncbi:uncharacterized RING finger protein C57A7.09-like [Humulus lupulus]|uniref:uncharacterized RING finger protein C57A7.09-like n=1 Tax=Humulus lupulus TaxID=3486 RepID=UPI002B41212C|nr:uncharacterized RING finger protein C57A7.09-like [Humulus lupulus]